MISSRRMCPVVVSMPSSWSEAACSLSTQTDQALVELWLLPQALTGDEIRATGACSEDDELRA